MKISGKRLEKQSSLNWTTLGVGSLSILFWFSSCATQATRNLAASDANEPKPAFTEATVSYPSMKQDSERSKEANAEYHFSLAQAYVAEGNPDRAIEEYKLTLMYDPSSALIYARLASEYIKKGMLSAAMEACKDALARNKDFVDARLILAGLYSSSQDNESALKEYDLILKKDPHHEEAVIYKSQVLAEEHQSAAAVKTLKAFIAQNPESVLAYYYLAHTEQGAGHFKEAVLAYRKAIDLRPSFAQASLSLGYLYEEHKMNDKALGVYKDLFESNQDLSAANRLATIYLKEEKYTNAMPYLEAIQNADPDDMNVRVKIGLIRMETKEYDKAIASFKYILTKSPDSDRVLYYLGSVYEEIKQFDQAITTLKKIKPASKLFSDSALHVAYLLKQKGDVAGAHDYIRDCIAQSPEVANFYIFQASLEEEAKDLKKATVTLEAAVKHFPEDEKILYYLGSIYDRQGNPGKGVEYMESILKVNPDNVDALNYIGYTWTIQGVRMSDAEKLLKHALALKPDNAYIQDSWGWYLFVRGRVSESVVELEKAVQLKPNESTILEHLADAYLKANLEEKALIKYRDAVRFADETDAEARHKLESKVKDLTRVLAEKGRLMPSEYAGGVKPSPGVLSPLQNQDRTPAKQATP